MPIGYNQPYATSHERLDEDHDVQEEVRVAARAVARAISLLRAGQLGMPDRSLPRPRPK